MGEGREGAGAQPATAPTAGSASPGAVARRRQVVVAGFAGDAAEARRALADPDPAVRVVALGAAARLGVLEPPDVLTALGDRDCDVRHRACEVAVDVVRAGHGATATGVVTALTGLLEDGEVTVSESAAWALGEVLGAEDLPSVGATRDVALRALAAVATAHADPLCRESAVAALGAIGDPGSLSTVVAALGDKPAVRRRAAVALAAFDHPDATAALERCLVDRDWQVRQVAEDLLDRPQP